LHVGAYESDSRPTRRPVPGIAQPRCGFFDPSRPPKRRSDEPSAVGWTEVAREAFRPQVGREQTADRVAMQAWDGDLVMREPILPHAMTIAIRIDVDEERDADAFSAEAPQERPHRCRHVFDVVEEQDRWMGLGGEPQATTLSPCGEAAEGRRRVRAFDRIDDVMERLRAGGRADGDALPAKPSGKVGTPRGLADAPGPEQDDLLAT
jgi:hypothetical protein